MPSVGKIIHIPTWHILGRLILNPLSQTIKISLKSSFENFIMTSFCFKCSFINLLTHSAINYALWALLLVLSWNIAIYFLLFPVYMSRSYLPNQTVNPLKQKLCSVVHPLSTAKYPGRCPTHQTWEMFNKYLWIWVKTS